MRLRNVVGVMLVAVPFLMSGCGGSSSSSSSTPVPDKEITVTPSLGKVSDATVSLFKSDGTTLLATSEIGTDGSVQISYSGTYVGPIVVVVAGDEDASYFDEASGTMIDFGTGKLLRSMVPSGTTETAVTILTEVAYQISVINSIALTDSIVTQLNGLVRQALAPELTSIIAAPFLFDSATTTGDLGNNEAGKYALRLAALAQLGAAGATPALTIVEQLAADFADGTLDGMSNSSAIDGLLYNSANLASNLNTFLSTLAASYGSAELQAALSTYTNISTSIDINDILPGGGGSTDLIATGDGAALAGGNGATGTVGSTTYTFTGHPVEGSALYAYFPLTDSGVFIAYNGTDPITRWQLSGFTNSEGIINCNVEAGIPSIMLTLSGVPHLATECVIEVLSVSSTEIEGRFAAVFSGLGEVTDGYFRYEVPVEVPSGGLGPQEFGYSMDVDGTEVTDNTVLALDGFDRQVAGFLTLGDTPAFQIRMIPEGVSGSYSCGEGPNSFRLVGMSYQGFTTDNESHPGSCSVDVTFAAGIYSGTFSGTLYNSDGDVMEITNGIVRNDGTGL